MIGTITRWGTRGYGFITSDGLESEAWLHAKFLEDPDYEPRQGDRVEFEPERLPDGRYQARRVRPLDAAATRAPRPASMSHSVHNPYNEGRVAVKLSLPPMVLAVAAHQAQQHAHAAHPHVAAPVERASEPVAFRSEAAMSELVAPAAATSGVSAMPAPSAQVVHGAHAAPAPAAAPEKEPEGERLGARLLRRSEGRGLDLERLQAEAASVEEQLAHLAEQRDQLQASIEAITSGVADAESRTVREYLESAVATLERDFHHKRALGDALNASRNLAIARSGLPTVLEYEELRGRLAEMAARNDVLALKAFRALERERRMTLPELANAADRFEAAPPVRARIVAFVPGNAGGAGTPAVLVAPLRAEPFAGAASPSSPGPLGPVAVHLACAFWQAAERALRESPGAETGVEHCRVAGALAVRVGSFDPSIFQLLLDEAWAARPDLAGVVQPEVELVEGVVPSTAVEPESLDGDDHVQEAHAHDPTAAGHGLPAVALRLRLSLRDLVALLADRGLPFVNDTVEPGTEETLRALLGEGEAAAASAHAGANGSSNGNGVHHAAQPLAAVDDESGELGDARSIAGRMLRKLLRDRRVGGRHTRIENAYGHHFSDGEKDLARRVAEWLEKDGILMPKLNEGSHHISINPRRLRDVGQIVDGKWERGVELDVL